MELYPGQFTAEAITTWWVLSSPSNTTAARKSSFPMGTYSFPALFNLVSRFFMIFSSKKLINVTCELDLRICLLGHADVASLAFTQAVSFEVFLRRIIQVASFFMRWSCLFATSFSLRLITPRETSAQALIKATRVKCIPVWRACFFPSTAQLDLRKFLWYKSDNRFSIKLCPLNI